MLSTNQKGAIAEAQVMAAAIRLGMNDWLPEGGFVPIADVDGQGYLHLRLAPARNNQELLVHWASEYRLGAIAQLGERVTGSHEVGGSSPPSSTS